MQILQRERHQEIQNWNLTILWLKKKKKERERKRRWTRMRKSNLLGSGRSTGRKPPTEVPWKTTGELQASSTSLAAFPAPHGPGALLSRARSRRPLSQGGCRTLRGRVGADLRPAAHCAGALSSQALGRHPGCSLLASD